MNPARLPRLELIAVDATSLMFTLVVSVAAGLAFGAIPVLKHARVRLAEALRAAAAMPAPAATATSPATR